MLIMYDFKWEAIWKRKPVGRRTEYAWYGKLKKKKRNTQAEQMCEYLGICKRFVFVWGLVAVDEKYTKHKAVGENLVENVAIFNQIQYLMQ